MDTSASVLQKTGNLKAVVPRSPYSIPDFNKAVALEAYRSAGDSDALPCVQFDAKIVRAVKRWTAHDGVRVEFYTTKSAGEIRVKIKEGDAGGTIYDMSLAAFIGISPAKI